MPIRHADSARDRKTQHECGRVGGQLALRTAERIAKQLAVYQLKTPYGDGTAHFVFDPLVLLARPAHSCACRLTETVRDVTPADACERGWLALPASTNAHFA